MCLSGKRRAPGEAGKAVRQRVTCGRMDVEGWIAFAERDLRAARAMKATGNLLSVGFHCQQAIEKLLKGRYVQLRHSVPPRVHDLARLAATLAESNDERWSAEAAFLRELTDLCTRARYGHPDWKATLAYLEEAETADRLLSRTEEIFAWLKSKLG